MRMPLTEQAVMIDHATREALPGALQVECDLPFEECDHP